MCEVKIRPFPNDTELTCDLEGEHRETTRHRATLRDYAYPGSETTLYWENADRRSFGGKWVPCDWGFCPLPLGHEGRHAG